MRHRGRVAYPVGRFTTTLATPELVAALDAGEVEEVHEVARYERGKPFTDWAVWVLGLRERSKRRGEESWERYAKALSVALSGRLARRPGGWHDRPRHTARRRWGEWHEVCAETGEEKTFRALGGHVQEWCRPGLREGTLAACYAHLTAYGRLRMREYREVAGPRQTIAQHTDGLVVTVLGAKRLRAAGCVRPGEWGHLQAAGQYKRAWFRGPNHFWADGKWTLAGVHHGFVVQPDGEVYSEVTINPVRTAKDPFARSILRRVVHTDPAEINAGDSFDRDGWAVPLNLGGLSCERQTLFDRPPVCRELG